MSFKELKEKIESKKAVVGVVGLGYVGLPLAVEFAQKGMKTIGFDVSEDKVSVLKNGGSYIQDVSTDDVKKSLHNGFEPVTDFKKVKELDAVIVCVPTPLRKTREPDLSFIIDASRAVSEHIQGQALIVLESTSYPGTTREILLPELEKKGFKGGEDVFVAFSPERVDPGNEKYGIKNTPKVVGGIEEKSLQLASMLYGLIVDEVVEVASCEEAEMVKLLENTFRAVNIGLINELTLLCDRFGLDIWNIIRAASTKPFGYMPFYPGPGLGGHCLPIDPQFLSWKAKSSQFYPRFIDLAEEINRSMPNYVVEKISRILNRKKKSVNGARILLLGVSYKRNVGDLRESPSFEVAEKLKEMNADISFSDPYVDNFLDLKKIECDGIDYSGYDCVVILTDHKDFDYPKIVGNAGYILDCRGVTLGLDGKAERERL